MLLYEVDDEADKVVRTAEVFADGAVRRNSVELEERAGVPIRSLIAVSVRDAFPGASLKEIEAAAFEAIWSRGTDAPFWSLPPTRS